MSFRVLRPLSRLVRARLIVNYTMNNDRHISNVMVIGAGQMGSGIAQVAAQTGHSVVLIDQLDGSLKNASDRINKGVQVIAKKQFPNSHELRIKFCQDTLGRIVFKKIIEDNIKETDLVVEAITENVKYKQNLFSMLDQLAPKSTIFASNTSSLSIAELSSVTQREDKFGGLHFFIPVPVMTLLEVIKSPKTSDETHKRLLEFGKTLGKVTIPCKDTPGFVVNRLLIPYLAEALRMLQRGDATCTDIDKAMKLGAGLKIGPMELMDYIGLDTAKNILDGWHHRDQNNDIFKSPALLDKLVAENKLGVKTGEGFYKYDKK